MIHSMRANEQSRCSSQGHVHASELDGAQFPYTTVNIQRLAAFLYEYSIELVGRSFLELPIVSSTLGFKQVCSLMTMMVTYSTPLHFKTTVSGWALGKWRSKIGPHQNSNRNTKTGAEGVHCSRVLLEGGPPKMAIKDNSKNHKTA